LAVTGNELISWVFSAATALTVAAGLLATRVRREWVTSLPMAHAAAIVLIALFGWESLVYLPSTIQVYTTGVAGIPDPAGVEAYQAFIVASAAFVLAAVLAIYGILRRRPWGLVFGIGVAGTRVAMTLASAVNLFSIGLDPFGPAGLAWNVVDLIALRVVPAVVAIVLLLWPLLSRSTAETLPVETVDWNGDPSPEAGR
jgi:hypothetical protein